MAANRTLAVDGSGTGSALVSSQCPSMVHCVKSPQINGPSLARNEDVIALGSNPSSILV